MTRKAYLLRPRVGERRCQLRYQNITLYLRSMLFYCDIKNTLCRNIVCFIILWRITHYCVVQEMNMLKSSLWVCYRRHISLRFSRNSDTIVSDLQENYEEMFHRFYIHIILWYSELLIIPNFSDVDRYENIHKLKNRIIKINRALC